MIPVAPAPAAPRGPAGGSRLGHARVQTVGGDCDLAPACRPRDPITLSDWPGCHWVRASPPICSASGTSAPTV